MNEIVEAYKQTAVNLLKNPDSAEDLTSQFILLYARGTGTAHLALARRCEAIEPKKFLPVFNLGSAQLKSGMYLEAVATFHRALKLAPPDQVRITMLHIGLANYSAGNIEEALKWCNRGRELLDDIDVQQSIAIARLMGGELEALFEFECKYHQPRKKPIAEAGIPRWMGEGLTGKTIVVAHEQGFGDTIQFARFIPRIGFAKRVIWSGPSSLALLMADNFQFDEMVGEDGPFEADYYCSPISICGALRTKYADVDPGPYMRAEPLRMPPRGKLKIGLAWAGNVDYAHDEERSIDLKTLTPLLEIPGAAFYSFQVGRGEDDITRLGLDGLIANLGGTLKTWAHTARAVAAMDLIVTVDSGVAHIAGALGKPVFILIPFANCWRWCRDSETTPWYSSARLFRQFAPGNWGEPVQWIKRAIEDKLNG